MMRDENAPSIKGLTAYYVLKVAYNMPILGPLAKNGQIREILNEYEREWKCPKGYELEKLTIEDDELKVSFNADLIKPEGYDDNEEKKMILQLHGGGYYNKLHNAYRDVAVEYIKRSFEKNDEAENSMGAAVLCPDYATAPFHPFPAALKDAVASYKYILDMGIKPENIIIAGDSAGGGLTLSLGLYLRNHNMPMPAGIITMSAWTDLTKSGDSYEDNFESDPLFGNTRDSLVYLEGYYRNSDPKNPYISPIFGDFKGFPPVLMQVGEKEMLLSDTVEVAKKMEETGLDVKMHIYPGMFHVFQLGLNLFPEEKEAWNEIEEFINKIFGQK